MYQEITIPCSNFDFFPQKNDIIEIESGNEKGFWKVNRLIPKTKTEGYNIVLRQLTSFFGGYV